jgi:hypothetical protein
VEYLVAFGSLQELSCDETLADLREKTHLGLHDSHLSHILTLELAMVPYLQDARRSSSGVAYLAVPQV